MKTVPRHWTGSILIACILVGCAGVGKSFKERTLDDYSPILSPDEYETLNSLTHDAEIQAYLEAYWRGVDPTPETFENETRTLYLERLDYASEHYPDRRGWGRSDQKRIYLEYGPPVYIERIEYSEVQISTFGSIRAIEVWLYSEAGQEKSFPSRGDRLFPGEKRFIFGDMTGNGVYKLLYSSEEGGEIDSRLFDFN